MHPGHTYEPKLKVAAIPITQVVSDFNPTREPILLGCAIEMIGRAQNVPELPHVMEGDRFLVLVEEAFAGSNTGVTLFEASYN